jgi:hypothetical protein
MTIRPTAEPHQLHAWGVFGAPLTQINRDNGKDLTVAFKLTQVATYKQSMLEAKTNRKTFNAKPRAVTA